MSGSEAADSSPEPPDLEAGEALHNEAVPAQGAECIRQPVEVTGEDKAVPYYVSSLRKPFQNAETEHSLTVGNTSISSTVTGVTSFPGKSGSVVMYGDTEGVVSQMAGSQTTQQEREGKMVTGMSSRTAPSTTTVTTSQYRPEAEAQIAGILTSDCHPVVITILVSNDNNAKTGQLKPDSEEAESDLNTNCPLPADKPPPFDAERSCTIVKTAQEDHGIMVIPVTNRPKEYLLAVLEALTSMRIPKSCEFFWFIFTGHGSCGAFSVNGQDMPFEKLIQKASKIPIKYMAFFFECCQRNNNVIKTAEIKKQYIAVYSSPPKRVSYHYNGVGVMVTCLAEILEDFKGSFSELQLLLRGKLMAMITEVLAIPDYMLDEFISNHLPVHTSTMYDDFSFYKKISAAMKPVINVQMITGKDEAYQAVVTVYNPERIIHHPSDSKFKLTKHIVRLETEDREEIIHDTYDVCFGENLPPITVPLPPQVCQMSGNLMVGAEYGDGRIEYSKPYVVEKLPCYEKPKIRSCKLQDNQCEVRVVYDAKNTHQESEYYHIEWVEIGYYNSSQWIQLHHKDRFDYVCETLVALLPSHIPVKRDLQVAVKYIKATHPVYSELYTVEQPAIDAPIIQSIRPEGDGLTAMLTFDPMQPSLVSQSDHYIIDGYHVRSRLDDKWKTVYEKNLDPGELKAEESAIIRLDLSKREKMCQYEVALHYKEIGDVKSTIFEAKVGAIAKPEIVSIENTDSVSATLKFFPHQPWLPSDPSLYQIDKYSILSRHKGGEWSPIFKKNFSDSPITALNQEEGVEIDLYLTIDEVVYQYQVILHYRSKTIGDVASYTFESSIDPIEKPEIISIDPVDKVTGQLRFMPNQPTSERKPDSCGVNRCQILSRYTNGDWEEVADETFPPSTYLGREKAVNIRMPLSLEKKKCQYQVVLHYGSTGAVKSVKLFEKKIDPIKKPCIDSVISRADNYSAVLKFSPNQPSSQINPELCIVLQYYIQSRVRNRDEWIKVFTKDLDPGEALDVEESVIISLHLLSERKYCEYQVIMCYEKGDVKSAIFYPDSPVEPIGAPQDVTITYNNWTGSSITISWIHPHSCPAESSIKDELGYKIIKADTPGEEELSTVPITSNSASVVGPVKGHVKVGVYNKEKDLGCVFSEPYKKNSIFCYLQTGFKKVPKCLKLFILVEIILLGLLLGSAIFLPFNSTSLKDQLIVANQTISYDPGWHVRSSRGVSFQQHVNEFSDNLDGLNVTAFSVDRSAIKTENFTVPPEQYAGVDQTIQEGKKRTVIPVNYYNYPLYLLKGSTIVLEAKINLLTNGDSVDYVYVYYFDSHDEAINYKQGGSNQRKVHQVNVTNCVKTSCNDTFTVDKDSFYFPVLSSHVDALFKMTTNFTFHVVRYLNSYSDSNIKCNIGLNETGFIPFDTSKEILIYAHPLSDPEEDKNMGHLSFTARVNLSKPLPGCVFFIPLALSLIGALVIVVYCVYYWITSKRKERPVNRLRRDLESGTSDETTHLLANQNAIHSINNE